MSAVIDDHGHAGHDHHHGPAKGLSRWLLTTNHKDIGSMYLWFSFCAFLLGGSMAMVIRAELFQPGLQIVQPEFFNQMTTMHGLIMVFGAVMPAFVGLANWMIPLMIGAPDMALPRMNNFSFWLLPAAFGLLVSTLFMEGGGPNFGWTFYAPLSTTYAPESVTFFIFAIHLMGISSIMGAINVIATILNLRAPGMTLMKMPLFVWTWLITAFLLIAVMPVLAGVAVVGLLVGGALFFLKSGTPSPAPSPAAKPLAVPVATVPAAPAIASSVQLALLESEVKRDPSGFKGDRYQFSVSSKGVLTGFQETGRTTPWIRNLGFMRLYGVTMQSDGRRAVRRAGDMNSPDYRAKVTKRVRDGAVVFDVVVAHPKFTLNQTFVCLPRSLKVEARFKPVSLADQSGPLDAVYGVHLETAEFVSPNARPLMRTGEVVYATKQGSLILRYDPSFTGAGSQAVVGDPALTSFVLAVAGGTKEQVLNYEIILP